MIELEYDMPSSNVIQANSVVSNTSTNNIVLTTTDGLANNDHVYIFDTSTSSFNVRMIHNVVNNSVIELTTRPSFNSSNADFGVIKNLNSHHAAFKFSANSGILRYVSSTDSVYDGFKNMAVKIVLTSERPYLVPRVADMRTIALQI
jgi:hypothetical protein